MSSFLNRLKEKKVIPSTPEDDKKEKLQTQAAAAPADAGSSEQLKVDIFQTTSAIIIYSQIAGATIEDFNVTIDGEGDTVTIRGERTRPDATHFSNPEIGAQEKEHVLEECSWGKFYRQIILPAEVDAEKTEAKMHDGVLMLLLPLKGMSSKGVRIPVTEIK